MRVLLTLGFAACTTMYFMAEKQVTLADDGRVVKVKTFAPTVGAALVRLGVSVGPDDLVSPSPISDLSDHIEVRRARDIVLVLNGARSIERVTGSTQEEVLAELDLDRGSRLYSSRDDMADGDALVVNHPVSTHLIHDGIDQPVVTDVLTAGALLRQLHIQLGPEDRVLPSIVAHPSQQTPIE
ncbi:MAG TPA: ubiquitin-like domain-containing protein, partial [Actinomycetota bacterium]|nr:ubiquitin-like domain-containing protein [Actinomycetota bacterium]